MRAAASVNDFLSRNGHQPRLVRTSLGLADPSELRIIVVFPTDGALGRFEASSERRQVELLARKALSDNNYPVDGLNDVLSFHSQETITRAGGDRNYFN